MNAYKLEFSGETEYISGKTNMHALRHYFSMTGVDISELGDDAEITQVTEEELDTIKIKNIDRNDEAEKEEWTIREMLSEFNTPTILGSTSL